MAASACPSCKNHGFETVEVAPRNSNFKLIFVQCTMCGAVVGVADYFNLGNLVKNQNKAIQKIAERLDVYLDPGLLD